MNLWKMCLGVLYPQTCYFCGKISKEPMCRKCAKMATYIKEPMCKKCGKPIPYEEKELYYDCENSERVFEQGKSVWIHKNPVRWSIYQFKYHNKIGQIKLTP